MNSVNLRAVVLDILTEINDKKEFSHLLINNALVKYQYLDKQERAFIGKLSLGTVEKKLELDYIINQFSKTPTKKMKPLIRNILEMSVYQIIYMDSVPDSASCNEAVKLVSKRGLAGLKGYVNGVLRNIARSKDNIVYPDKNNDYISYLSVRYSVPDWIIMHWKDINGYSLEKIEDILIGFSREKRTYIRCNTLKNSVNELIDILKAEGVKVTRPDIEEPSYALEISDYDYLNGLKSFNEGRFIVQDISSIRAGVLAGFKNGDKVLDVCAAPGGKTINAALYVGKEGNVISRDLSDNKVSLIEDNIRRTGLTNVKCEVWDALKLDESMIGSMDKVIADLPCSGLGVIGRKPDIKYNASIKGMQDLSLLQRDILSVVHRYVKKDGYLIYSTCTINKNENEDNARWVTDNLGFVLEEEIQMLPFDDCADGFYVARLRKL